MERHLNLIDCNTFLLWTYPQVGHKCCYHSQCVRLRCVSAIYSQRYDNNTYAPLEDRSIKGRCYNRSDSNAVLPYSAELDAPSLMSSCYYYPRRACAARATDLRYLVRVCVSAAPFRPLRVKVSPQNDTNASSRQDKE